MDQNSEDSDGKRRDFNGRIDSCTGWNINPLLWGEYKVYNVRICV